MNDKLNNNVTIIPPFKKFCMTIGELPTSYTETMTYYEMLLWFTNYIGNTLIPAINNNGEAVTELQEKYVELKNYVDNYFENLDVQEEINNKLDDMADSGELAEIIAQYLEVASVLGFDTKSALKGAENVVSGSICKTLGDSSYGTGDGHFYRIRELEEGDVIDDDELVALTNYPLLVAEKIADYDVEQLKSSVNTIETRNEIVDDSVINVLLNGVKGDGVTDDTSAIQDIIDNNPSRTIYFPDGEYLISSPIEVNVQISSSPSFILDTNAVITSNSSLEALVEINGDGNAASNPFRLHKRAFFKGGILDCNNADVGIKIDSTMQFFTVEDTNFINVDGIGIYLYKNDAYISNDALINNVCISGKSSIKNNASTGILIDSFDNELNNIRIQGTERGIVINGGGIRVYNAHVLYIGHTAPTKTLYENTIAFLINTASTVFNSFNDCYSDAMCYGFKITNNALTYIDKGFMSSYLDPIESMDTAFIWATTPDVLLNVTNSRFEPSSSATSFTAHNIKIDGNKTYRLMTNAYKLTNNNWVVNSHIPDNDLSYSLGISKSNQIYTNTYTNLMEQNTYYKIGLVSISQGVTSFRLSMASEGSWIINVKWSGGGNLGDAVITKTNLDTPSKSYTLCLCDSFVENNIRYGYLCIKTSAVDAYNNAAFDQVTSCYNGTVYCGYEKYGLSAYTPTTVIREVSLDS